MSKVSFGFGISFSSFLPRPRSRVLRLWPLSALVLAAPILAGCGGSRSSNVQTVHGSGFSFQAPAAWAIVRSSDSVAAVDGPVDRVEVLRFTLEKPYRPELFSAVSRELDGVADRLAGQLSGRVAERTTSDVAGRRVRTYRIEYGSGRTQEIAFVLDGRDEFQVLCRRPTTAGDATCRQLFSTFALG